MSAQLDRVTRFGSPATLLLAVILFLLPFCAVSCNSPFGGSGDLMSASGLKLVTGGDAGFNCDFVTRQFSAISSSFGNALGSGSTSTTTSTSSSSSSETASTTSESTTVSTVSTSTSSGSSSTASAGPCGSSASSSAAGGQAAAGSFDKLTPFSPTTSTDPSAVHVDRQAIAAVALGFLVVGILAAVIRDRVRMLVVAVAALAAAASLVVLRIVLTHDFNDDISRAASSQKGSAQTLGPLSDPSNFFALSWGAGWLLVLVLALLVATINAIAFVLPRLGRGSAVGATPPPPGGPPLGWRPPPQGMPPPAEPPRGPPT